VSIFNQADLAQTPRGGIFLASSRRRRLRLSSATMQRFLFDVFEITCLKLHLLFIYIAYAAAEEGAHAAQGGYARGVAGVTALACQGAIMVTGNSHGVIFLSRDFSTGQLREVGRRCEGWRSCTPLLADMKRRRAKNCEAFIRRIQSWGTQPQAATACSGCDADAAYGCNSSSSPGSVSGMPAVISKSTSTPRCL